MYVPYIQKMQMQRDLDGAHIYSEVVEHTTLRMRYRILSNNTKPEHYSDEHVEVIQYTECTNDVSHLVQCTGPVQSIL